MLYNVIQSLRMVPGYLFQGGWAIRGIEFGVLVPLGVSSHVVSNPHVVLQNGKTVLTNHTNTDQLLIIICFLQLIFFAVFSNIISYIDVCQPRCDLYPKSSPPTSFQPPPGATWGRFHSRFLFFLSVKITLNKPIVDD